MSRKARPERIKKFRRDLRLLKQKYSNDEIAARSNIDPANLSSYSTGSKTAGEMIIDKFYKEFDIEIKHMDYQLPDDDDPQQTADDSMHSNYGRTGERENRNAHEEREQRQPHDDREDHIRTLKKNNDHLIAMNGSLKTDLSGMVNIQEIGERNTESALALAAESGKNVTKMVDLVVSRFGPRRKGKDGNTDPGLS